MRAETLEALEREIQRSIKEYESEQSLAWAQLRARVAKREHKQLIKRLQNEVVSIP